MLVEWWAEMRSAPYAPFHVFEAFSLGPEIDAAALEQALNVLASRHEILRTSFSDPKRMQLSRLPQDVLAQLARIKAGERITPRRCAILCTGSFSGRAFSSNPFSPV